jgi:hypothetical protein
MKIKVVALVLALTVTSVPLTARALGFPGLGALSLIPDLCFVSCIQFTHAQLLLQIQQYLGLVQNFTHIQNLAGLQGSAQQVIGIINAASAAPPVVAGNAAAATTIEALPAATNRITAIDAQAVAADGVDQQGEVASAYASTIASNTATTNTILSNQQKQNQATVDQLSDNLLDLETGDMPADGI